MKVSLTNHIRTLGVSSVALVFLASISGCQAIHTSVKKRNLDVQTKMSETVFLEPVKPAHRVIYISVRNTSDKQLDIKQRINGALVQSGYKVTDDPDKANFMLQGNVLQCGKSDLRASEDAHRAGWGGAWAGIALAGATGSHRGSSYAGAGLVGAIAGVVGDALVDDTLFAMITDIEIRERPRTGEVVTQSQDTNATQGTSTRLRQSTSGGQVNWKIYRSRIVSTANKANLQFEEALPALEDGLVRSVAGIFVE